MSVGSAIAGGANLGIAVLRIGLDSTQGIAGLLDFKARVVDIGDKISTMGMALSGVGAVIKTGLGGAAVHAMQVAASIEAASTEARVMAGISKEAWRDIDRTIEDAGKVTGSQLAAADAVRKIVSAGYGFTNGQLKGTELQDLTTTTIEFSKALGESVPKGMAIMISAMESFTGGRIGEKLDPRNLKRIADLLGNVQAASRLEAPDLQDFVQQMGGLMAVEKFDPEQMLAEFGAMNQVMGNGSMAATSMRQGLDMLIRLATGGMPTHAREASAALATIGKTLDDINPRIVSLTKASKNLVDSGLMKSGNASIMFGVQGKQGLSVLGQAPEMVKQIIENGRNMTDIHGRYQQNLETMSSKWTMVMGRIENFWKQFGQALNDSGIKEWMDGFINTLDNVTAYIKENPKEIVKWVQALMHLGGWLLTTGAALYGMGLAAKFVVSMLNPFQLIGWAVALGVVYQAMKEGKTGFDTFVAGLSEVKSKLIAGDLVGAWEAFRNAVSAGFPTLGKWLGYIENTVTTIRDRWSDGSWLTIKTDNPILSWLQSLEQLRLRFEGWITDLKKLWDERLSETGSIQTAWKDVFFKIGTDITIQLERAVKAVWASLTKDEGILNQTVAWGVALGTKLADGLTRSLRDYLANQGWWQVLTYPKTLVDAASNFASESENTKKEYARGNMSYGDYLSRQKDNWTQSYDMALLGPSDRERYQKMLDGSFSNQNKNDLYTQMIAEGYDKGNKSTRPYPSGGVGPLTDMADLERRAKTTLTKVEIGKESIVGLFETTIDDMIGQYVSKQMSSVQVGAR